MTIGEKKLRGALLVLGYELAGGKNKKEIEQLSLFMEIFHADLSDITSIESLIRNIKSKTREIEVLVNIAGIWHGKGEIYSGKNLKVLQKKLLLTLILSGYLSQHYWFTPLFC